MSLYSHTLSNPFLTPTSHSPSPLQPHLTPPSQPQPHHRHRLTFLTKSSFVINEQKKKKKLSRCFNVSCLTPHFIFTILTLNFSAFRHFGLGNWSGFRWCHTSIFCLFVPLIERDLGMMSQLQPFQPRGGWISVLFDFFIDMCDWVDVILGREEEWKSDMVVSNESFVVGESNWKHNLEMGSQGGKSAAKRFFSYESLALLSKQCNYRHNGLLVCKTRRKRHDSLVLYLFHSLSTSSLSSILAPVSRDFQTLDFEERAVRLLFLLFLLFQNLIQTFPK